MHAYIQACRSHEDRRNFVRSYIFSLDLSRGEMEIVFCPRKRMWRKGKPFQEVCSSNISHFIHSPKCRYREGDHFPEDLRTLKCASIEDASLATFYIRKRFGKNCLHKLLYKRHLTVQIILAGQLGVRAFVAEYKFVGHFARITLQLKTLMK